MNETKLGHRKKSKNAIKREYAAKNVCLPFISECNIVSCLRTKRLQTGCLLRNCVFAIFELLEGHFRKSDFENT